ncbi:MAG: MopE-related protein [Myxococcota bacterium]|nr:MopE-related protein [Myxococcota bacterium]
MFRVAIFTALGMLVWSCGATTDTGTEQGVSTRDGSISRIQPESEMVPNENSGAFDGSVLPVLGGAGEMVDAGVVMQRDATPMDNLTRVIDAGVDIADAALPDANFMLAPPMVDGGSSNQMNAGVYPNGDENRVNGQLCPPASRVATGCLDALQSEAEARLCDGFDNDCDGVIDEGCSCKSGAVQPCFLGPPNRVNTGACRPGTQRCSTIDGRKAWGSCDGAIGPSEEVCDGLDNDCNGCADELFGCNPDGQCPAPGDPRIPEGSPFQDYALRGGDFFDGQATGWSWQIEGGPCDQVLPNQTSFELIGANQEEAIFRPKLSGSYRVTMRVQTADGPFECSWIIDVIGPGVRIEMCYPESTTQDLDLYLMRPTAMPENGPFEGEPWFANAQDVYNPNLNACCWANCEAMIRMAPGRVDWGYPNTDIMRCNGGPQGNQWAALGFCANPRLDIDNNLSEGTGLPENINIDNPADGDGYRIMVQNFTGRRARPIVNVYCGGRLKATYGAPPDIVPNFEQLFTFTRIGAMWRVADVRVQVDPMTQETDCTVRQVHPPGQNEGFDVTRQDGRF